MAILQDVSRNAKGETPAQEIARLREENAQLKAKAAARNNRALTWKVSEKGAVSIYGMGRFPVTLYLSQARKLNQVWTEFMAFVEAEAEAGNLKTKDVD